MKSKKTQKLSLKKVTILNFEEATRIAGAGDSDTCDYSEEICPNTQPGSCEICQTVNEATCYDHECTSY
jgi:hypothetical protein